MPPVGYSGLDDDDGPIPSFDYTAMPIDLEESIAQFDTEERSRVLDEEDEVVSLLFANIVRGAVYGDTQATFPDIHTDIDLGYFANVARTWADERQISLFLLDPASRMDLSKHFWKVARAERKTSRPARRSSAAPVACTTSAGTAAAPIVVDSSPDPTPSSSQQARDNNHTFVFDCDDSRPAPKSAPLAWTKVSRRRNTPSAPPAPAPPTYASAASKPAAPPLPPSVAQATTGLSRDTLMTMTAAEVRSAFTLRFGGRLGRNHTKEGVVEAYLSKARADTNPAAPTKASHPKILQSTEFTVVRDPDSFGLKAHNCVDGMGRRRDAASIIRQLQGLIRSALPPRARPRAELIGGRWSSQSSSNFVLTFGGQPSNDDVLSLREVFYDFFGPGSLLLPAKGYTRLLFNLVPIPSFPLPSAADLLQEMSYNPVCQDLTVVAPPHWVNANKLSTSSRHGSISFAFIDPDGSRLANIKRSPPCLYGGVVRPRLGVSKPLITQCARCWKLGHAIDTCNRKAGSPICFICGAGHDGSMHGILCLKSRKHDSLKCNCQVTCLNCKNTGHHAKDARCPLRRKFRKVDNRTGDSSDEEAKATSAAAALDDAPPPAPTTSHPSVPVTHD